jgi:hypothetical protein
MKKKALLLMLFFMFISTNAVSQVSCGEAAAEVDRECYNDLLEICDREYNFYVGSCAPTRKQCEKICDLESQLCYVTTGDWMTCSQEFFICMQMCDWKEGNCRYVAGETFFECNKDAYDTCLEDPVVEPSS